VILPRVALLNLTFDTENVLIKVDGDIKLGPEELNLEIKGEPKKIPAPSSSNSKLH
jgi:hypothetical protein